MFAYVGRSCCFLFLLEKIETKFLWILQLHMHSSSSWKGRMERRKRATTTTIGEMCSMKCIWRIIFLPHYLTSRWFVFVSSLTPNRFGPAQNDQTQTNRTRVKIRLKNVFVSLFFFRYFCHIIVHVGFVDLSRMPFDYRGVSIKLWFMLVVLYLYRNGSHFWKWKKK